MDVTDEQRKELEKNIVESVIRALEKNELSQDQLSPIGSFVLERIDSITDNNALVAFLSDLSSRWPIFKDIAVVHEGKIRDVKEDKTVKDVLTLAQNGKIDDAISLAKTMTNT